MRDVDPFVLRRMLALRQFPMFGDAELGELANVAENIVDETFPAGALIAPAGARVPALQLVLAGRVVTTGARADTWGPREVFGATEVLARRDLAAPAYAATDTRTLQLFAADVTEVLDENFGVLRALLRELATRAVAAAQPRAPIIVPDATALGFVERFALLRQQAPFAGAGLDALAQLAHATEVVRFAAGATMARAGDPVEATLVIVSGSVDAGLPRKLGRGDSIGALEVLAELPHGRAIEAIVPVTALRASATSVFDVLEDHTDFGIAMLRTLATELLDAPTTN